MQPEFPKEEVNVVIFLNMRSTFKQYRPAVKLSSALANPAKLSISSRVVYGFSMLPCANCWQISLKAEVIGMLEP